MYIYIFIYIYIYVQSIFSQKSRAEIGYGINVWVLCELSECKKWGKMDNLGVVGTL